MYPVCFADYINNIYILDYKLGYESVNYSEIVLFFISMGPF